jgi:hypothetical protein
MDVEGKRVEKLAEEAWTAGRLSGTLAIDLASTAVSR